MEPFDWRAFLTKWTKELIEREKDKRFIPEDVIQTNWLGFPGATEEQIERAEARLGVKLPPSYRAFLMTTNGWRQLADWMPAHAGRFWSVEEIDWYSARHQDRIDAWMDGVRYGGGPSEVPDEEYLVYGPGQDCCNLRHEYFQTNLEVSDNGDSAQYMLNPKVVTPEGEWEAWFFATWYAGASRYRSFQEMMQDRYEDFVEHGGSGF